MTDEYDATDMEVVQAHIQRLGVTALADQIRAQHSQLTPASAPRESMPVIEPRRALPQYESVTWLPIDEPMRRSWMARHWHHVALGAAITAAGLAVAWMVMRMIDAVIDAVGSAGNGANGTGSGLLGVAALGLLVLWLCCRRGGGSSFSGTFQGKIR